jgi:hypothetical protein
MLETLMPRYFFHIYAHDDHRIEDEEGCDLRDDAAAVIESIASAHELAAEAARTGRAPDRRIVVINEAGTIVRTVAVGTVLSTFVPTLVKELSAPHVSGIGEFLPNLPKEK